MKSVLIPVRVPTSLNNRFKALFQAHGSRTTILLAALQAAVDDPAVAACLTRKRKPGIMQVAAEHEGSV